MRGLAELLQDPSRSPQSLGKRGVQLPQHLGHRTAFSAEITNDPVSLQTKLHTMAEDLRIPLGHGGPSVNQVSAMPA